MDLEKFSFPPELETDDIPAHQLKLLEKIATPQELEAIKESNVVRRQMLFVAVKEFNLDKRVAALESRVADHETYVDITRKLKWLALLTVSLASFAYTIIQIAKALKALP